LLYVNVFSVLAAGVATNGQKKDSDWMDIWGLKGFVGSRPVVPEDSGWMDIWGLKGFVGSRPVVPEWEGKE